MSLQCGADDLSGFGPVVATSHVSDFEMFHVVVKQVVNREGFESDAVLTLFLFLTLLNCEPDGFSDVIGPGTQTTTVHLHVNVPAVPTLLPIQAEILGQTVVL